MMVGTRSSHANSRTPCPGRGVAVLLGAVVAGMPHVAVGEPGDLGCKLVHHLVEHRAVKHGVRTACGVAGIDASLTGANDLRAQNVGARHRLAAACSPAADRCALAVLAQLRNRGGVLAVRRSPVRARKATSVPTGTHAGRHMWRQRRRGPSRNCGRTCDRHCNRQ